MNERMNGWRKYLPRHRRSGTAAVHVEDRSGSAFCFSKWNSRNRWAPLRTVYSEIQKEFVAVSRLRIVSLALSTPLRLSDQRTNSRQCSSARKFEITQIVQINKDNSIIDTNCLFNKSTYGVHHRLVVNNFARTICYCYWSTCLMKFDEFVNRRAAQSKWNGRDRIMNFLRSRIHRNVANFRSKNAFRFR